MCPQVEAAAREEAKVDFEAERRMMQVKMESEVQELQTHLKYGGDGPRPAPPTLLCYYFSGPGHAPPTLVRYYFSFCYCGLCSCS